MTTAEMIRGLVRAAEMIEQRDGGAVWDDEIRRALYAARDLGWKNGKSGALQLELPDSPASASAPQDLGTLFPRDVR